MKKAGFHSLTAKQREALELTLKRMSSKEIARELGISHKSVDKRIDAARVKLGAATRGEAARVYGMAMYGESLPKAALPVQHSDVITESQTRSPSSELETMREATELLAAHVPAQLWRTALGRGPREISKIGRVMFVLVGALVMCLVVLVGLGITQGFERVLFQ